MDRRVILNDLGNQGGSTISVIHLVILNDLGNERGSTISVIHLWNAMWFWTIWAKKDDKLLVLLQSLQMITAINL